MRRLLWLVPVLLTTACGGGVQPVDPSQLPPMSGKEQALMIAADGALRSGDSNSAIRDYQSAVAASEGHVEAHLALAQLYMNQQQNDLAKTVLERALQYQPQHPQVNYELGKILLNENKPGEAAKHFREGLVRDPQSADLLNGSGIASDMLGDHEAAQAAYEQALVHATADAKPMIRTNLGMSYLLSGDAKKAIATLKEAAKQKDASPVTKQNLALAYGLLGHTTEAKSLVKGELTEEERQEALDRLKAYLQ